MPAAVVDVHGRVLLAGKKTLAFGVPPAAGNSGDVPAEVRINAPTGADSQTVARVAVGLPDGREITCLRIALQRQSDSQHPIAYLLLRDDSERLPRFTLPQGLAFREIVDFLPDATLAIDLDGRVIVWNKAMEELTGTPSADMLGKGDYAYALPLYGYRRPFLLNYLLDPKLDVHSAYPDVQREGEGLSGEYHLPDALIPGEFYWIRAGLLYDAEGNLAGAIESIRDITAHKNVQAQLEQQKQMLQNLSRQLTQSEERQRRQVASDLHDRIGQSLVACKVHLEMLAESQDCPHRDELRQLAGRADDLIQEVRSMTFELCPPVLYDFGLAAGLRWLAEHLADRYPLRVDVEAEEEKDGLSDDVRAFLYRAAQELLMNVIKHAGAERARVSLEREDGGYVLSVEDDGCGMPLPGRWPDEPRVGFGLFSIQQRIENMNGRFQVKSSEEGTLVTLALPGLRPPITAEEEEA